MVASASLRVRRFVAENPSLWLNILIIGAVLAASFYLGGRASTRWLMMAAALMIGPVIVVLFLRYPGLDVLAVVVTGLLVPFAIGTGTGTAITATVLVLSFVLILWLLEMMRQRQIRLVPAGPVAPAVALAIVTLLAFIAGQIPWFLTTSAPLRSQLGGLAIFLLSVGAYLLAANRIRSMRWLQWLTWTFLALAALYFVGQVNPLVGRVANRFLQHGTNGSVFWVWTVVLAFSQALFNRRLSPALRLGLGALTVTALYVGFGLSRTWTSGWLPPLIGLLAVVWIAKPRAGTLAAFAGAAALVLGLPQVRQFILAANEYSFDTRVDAARVLLDIIRNNPLLGFGPANYYWYTPLFAIRGYYVSFNSHNQYLDIVAQVGVIGLACFLWFAWENARLAWRLRIRVPDGFARAYVYGAFGGLAGMLAAGMLGDWVIPFVYNQGVRGLSHSVPGWLFLGGLVSLQAMLREDSSNSA